MLRGIFALCAGLFAAMIAITGVELVNAKWIYPIPAGVNLRDPAQLQAFVAAMPTQAHALILGGWLLGAGGYFSVARFFSKRRKEASTPA